MAALLNFFCFGGLGYLLLGQWQKAILVCLSTFVLSCFGVGVIVPVLGVVDALMLGAKLGRGEPIGTWETFGMGPDLGGAAGGSASPLVIAVVMMFVSIPMIGILAAIAIPNFVEMQYRAKRAEAPANVDGIKTAMLAYEAAFDRVPEPCGPHPRDPYDLDKLAVPWTDGSCFDELGWSPDGDVRATYWTEVHGDDWSVHGLIDLDHDGEPAYYVATKHENTQVQTPNDLY